MFLRLYLKYNNLVFYPCECECAHAYNRNEFISITFSSFLRLSFLYFHSKKFVVRRIYHLDEPPYCYVRFMYVIAFSVYAGSSEAIYVERTNKNKEHKMRHNANETPQPPFRSNIWYWSRKKKQQQNYILYLYESGAIVNNSILTWEKQRNNLI